MGNNVNKKPTIYIGIKTGEDLLLMLKKNLNKGVKNATSRKEMFTARDIVNGFSESEGKINELINTENDKLIDILESSINKYNSLGDKYKNNLIVLDFLRSAIGKESVENNKSYKYELKKEEFTNMLKNPEFILALDSAILMDNNGEDLKNQKPSIYTIINDKKFDPKSDPTYCTIKDLCNNLNIIKTVFTKFDIGENSKSKEFFDDFVDGVDEKTRKILFNEGFNIDSLNGNNNFDENIFRVDHKLIEETINKPIGDNYLTEEQRLAVRELSSSNVLSCIVGYAGAGKSYVMRPVREIYKQMGFDIYGSAISWNASFNLSSSANFNQPIYNSDNSLSMDVGEGRDQALALKKMLYDIESSGSCGLYFKKPSVIIVDEAGLVDQRLLSALILESNKCSTRKENPVPVKIILAGDPKQLCSIEAGKTFESIVNMNVSVCYLTEIRRQELLTQRSMVRLLAEGNPGEALYQMAVDGGLNFIKTKEKTLDYMSKKIVSRIVDNKDKESKNKKSISMLGIVSKNKDLNDLNIRVRNILQEIGYLRGEGCVVKTELPPKGKENERNEKVMEEKLIAIGDSIEIRATMNNVPLYKSMNGCLNRDKNGKQDDKIQNSLYNRYRGEIADIKQKSDGSYDIVVEFKGEVKGFAKINTEKDKTKDGGIPLDYSYAITGYSSQGQTVDEVVCMLDPETSFLDMRNFYVQNSRHKKNSELIIVEEEMQKLIPGSRQKNNTEEIFDVVSSITLMEPKEVMLLKIIRQLNNTLKDDPQLMSHLINSSNTLKEIYNKELQQNKDLVEKNKENLESVTPIIKSHLLQYNLLSNNKIIEGLEKEEKTLKESFTKEVKNGDKNEEEINKLKEKYEKRIADVNKTIESLKEIGQSKAIETNLISLYQDGTIHEKIKIPKDILANNIKPNSNDLWKLLYITKGIDYENSQSYNNGSYEIKDNKLKFKINDQDHFNKWKKKITNLNEKINGFPKNFELSIGDDLLLDVLVSNKCGILKNEKELKELKNKERELEDSNPKNKNTIGQEIFNVFNKHLETFQNNSNDFLDFEEDSNDNNEINKLDISKITSVLNDPIEIKFKGFERDGTPKIIPNNIDKEKSELVKTTLNNCQYKTWIRGKDNKIELIAMGNDGYIIDKYDYNGKSLSGGIIGAMPVFDENISAIKQIKNKKNNVVDYLYNKNNTLEIGRTIEDCINLLADNGVNSKQTKICYGGGDVDLSKLFPTKSVFENEGIKNVEMFETLKYFDTKDMPTINLQIDTNNEEDLKWAIINKEFILEKTKDKSLVNNINLVDKNTNEILNPEKSKELVYNKYQDIMIKECDKIINKYNNNEKLTRLEETTVLVLSKIETKKERIKNDLKNKLSQGLITKELVNSHMKEINKLYSDDLIEKINTTIVRKKDSPTNENTREKQKNNNNLYKNNNF